jgi:hypothetical protein
MTIKIYLKYVKGILSEPLFDSWSAIQFSTMPVWLETSVSFHLVRTLFRVSRAFHAFEAQPDCLT